MKQYKGLYIDGTIFTCKADIDSFLKGKAIEAYKNAVWAFCKESTMEASMMADQKAAYLNTQFGMNWEEIEEIELAAMAA